ncbi:MAG: hypothetical protein BROFUL_03052, partial [Candidatus Brocadia fulgida]
LPYPYPLQIVSLQEIGNAPYKEGVEKSLNVVSRESTLASEGANFPSDKREEILNSIMKKEVRFV